MRLKDVGLLFKIQVPYQGTMAAVEFSRLLDAQLALNHYSLPAPPEGEDVGEPNDLHSQRWILLHTTVRSGVYTLKPHPKVNDNTFGYRDFVKLDGKFSNPLTNDNAPVTLPWIQVGVCCWSNYSYPSNLSLSPTLWPLGWAR